MIHYNIASLVPLVLTPVGGSAPKNTEVLYLYLVLALASGHGRYIAVTLLSAGFGQRPRTNAGTGSAPHQNKTVGFGQRPRPLHKRYCTLERTLLSVEELPLHIIAVINL